MAHHERELLQRGDDDPGLLPGQRRGELGGVLVDLLDHAVGVLELVDRVLQLAVQHHPVGDHHHLVEHLVVARRAATTAGAPARRSCSTSPTRPSAAPGTTGPAPSLAGVGLQAQHGVPLVEPGEDRRRRAFEPFEAARRGRTGPAGPARRRAATPRSHRYAGAVARPGSAGCRRPGRRPG